MSKALDPLTLLETFTRICDRGSISAAARDLGLSQASASRQLRALEERLGIQLIRRTTHTLAVTEAGLALLSDARGLIADWQAIEERHAASAGVVKGPLKVVAPVALGQLHLAEIAFAFQRAHPLVSLTWQLEDQAIRFSEVGCDCWIRIGPVPDDRLVVRRLGRVERLVVARPELPGVSDCAGTDDAERLPFVALDPFEGGRIGLYGPGGASVEIAPVITVHTNSIFALHRAVLAGLGTAILPRWFVEGDLQSGRLVDVLSDWRAARLDVNVAFLPARRQPERLRLFLQALEQGLQAMPGVAAGTIEPG